MTEQAKTRRLQDTLSIAGGAVVAFCVWSLAKICLFLTFADAEALRSFLGIDDTSLIIAVYVSLGVIAIIDLSVRTYVGFSARAEGHGKKKSSFYLVVAIIAAAANISSLIAIALSASSALSLLSFLVSVAIEATAIGAIVLVVYCSLRLRRMSRAAG